MENKINIAKLLKDCPKGMELDCVMSENVFFDCVTDNPIYPIRLYVQSEKDSITLTSFGCTTPSPYAKCVIFPKSKTTWEGFVPPCKFKDGDIVITKTSNNFLFYSIYQGIENSKVLTYVDYTPDDNRLINVGEGLCYTWEIIEQRFATEEEKQKLFQAIKGNGYCWNPESKTLEKLIEPKFKVGDKIEKLGYRFTIIQVKDNNYLTKCGNKIPIDNQDDFTLVPNKFDITSLKPFDKVLVRDSDKKYWSINLFGFYNEITKQFHCMGNSNIGWNECIPYEGNEHLLGTNNNCDEFYKTWE